MPNRKRDKLSLEQQETERRGALPPMPNPLLPSEPDAADFGATVERVWNMPVSRSETPSEPDPAQTVAESALGVAREEARALELRGSSEAAAKVLRDALAAHESVLSSDNPVRVAATIALVRLLIRSGEASSAAQVARTLLDAHTRAGGYIDRVVASVAYELGVALLQMRDSASALPVFERSGAAYLLTGGSTSWESIRAHTRAVEVAHSLGRFQECDDAVSSLPFAGIDLHPPIESEWNDQEFALVRAIRLGGRFAEARRMLHDAAAHLAASSPATAFLSARVFHELALCEWLLDDSKEAASHWKLARERLVDAGKGPAEFLALAYSVLAHLGFCALQNGSNADAFEILTEARGLETGLRGPRDRPSIAALYLSVFSGSNSSATSVTQLSSASDWFRLEYGDNHPWTASLRNDLAFVHARAGQWERAGKVLDELKTVEGFGVAGRDVVGGCIAYNAFLVAAVLGRGQQASEALDRVLSSTESMNDHPLHLKASDQRPRWSEGSLPQRPLDASVATAGLRALPLAE